MSEKPLQLCVMPIHVTARKNTHEENCLSYPQWRLFCSLIVPLFFRTTKPISTDLLSIVLEDFRIQERRFFFSKLCNQKVQVIWHVVGQNDNVHYYSEVEFKHVCKNLYIFLLFKRFLCHSLNENLLLLNFLSHFFHLVPCIWEFRVLKVNSNCTLHFCIFNSWWHPLGSFT